jgi:hypothetical protein
VAPASTVLEDALRVAREQEALTWEPLASTWHARFTDGFFIPDLRDAKALPDGTGQTR